MFTVEHSLDQTVDESSAILAAKQGELTAFNQLARKYEAIMYGVAYRILQNEDDAIDATQASLFNAYRRLDRFYLDNFRGWLVRIVINASYDLLRLRKRHPFISLDEMMENAKNYRHLPPDPHELPETYVERDELNRMIYAGIDTLRSEHRTILLLADIHGFTYEEIAQIMNWPLGTVKSSLSRARANLRDYLINRPDVLPLTFQRCTLQRQSAKVTQKQKDTTYYLEIDNVPLPLSLLHSNETYVTE